MIVPSMSLEEIRIKIIQDMYRVFRKTDYIKRDFDRIALKATNYPFTRTFEHKSPYSNIVYQVQFTILEKKQRDRPAINIYSMYDRTEGKYAVSIVMATNMITILPPHFFKRYRERIVKDQAISNQEIMKRYFNSSWGFTWTLANQDFKSAYRKFENERNGDDIHLVGATKEGYCFGEKQGDVFLIKTIISEEMLFDDQKELFHGLRKSLSELVQNTYGIKNH